MLRILRGFFTLVLCAAPLAAWAATDTPGTRFRIDPDHLPKPYATPAAALSPHVVARPRSSVPQAPPGFSVTVFADGLSNPRWMAVAPDGDVFLAEPHAGKVSILRDSNHDGKADIVKTFASGFSRPHGLAFHNGALFVGDTQAVWRLAYHDGALKAGAKTRVTHQGFGGTSGHWTRDIAFSPTGQLFVAIGSGANIEEEPLPRASVQMVTADGKLQTFASGLRNPVGIAFYPGTDELYVTVNERDGLGNNLPPDYLTRIREGDFFGWPYAYTGPHPDPVYGKKRPDLVKKTKMPDMLLKAHSAPLGLVFYESTQFPAEYKGNAFVALHGSWNANDPTGYKVVRVIFKNGRPENAYENFITGFRKDDKRPAEVFGRPAGLAVAKDGSLFIADDAGKTVWRVSYSRK